MQEKKLIEATMSWAVSYRLLGVASSLLEGQRETTAIFSYHFFYYLNL